MKQQHLPTDLSLSERMKAKRGRRSTSTRNWAGTRSRFSLTSLRQPGKNMPQPCEWFDTACATGQHQTVDDGTGFGPLDCIATESSLSSSCKNSDVMFQQIVVDRHTAVIAGHFDSGVDAAVLTRLIRAVEAA